MLVSDDDRALMERLAALEAEVKADADAQAMRKQVATDKVRAQRAAQEAERAALRPRAAEPSLARRLAAAARDEADSDGDGDDLGSALALAKRAAKMKTELSRPPKKGEKSWVKSGVASLALGPIGWLYAGSWREAAPASAIWVLLAVIASKILPAVLLMPVLMIALPLSAIAGVVYALQYNRAGGRQRLFDKDPATPSKALPPARPRP